MRNKYKSIICSLLLCSTLSNSYAASDDCIEAYTPGTSSKVGLLKAGLIGVGLMSMVSPVETVPIKGFVGCYLGTIDPQDYPNMDYIKIKTIKSTLCNFYYNYSDNQFTPIDMPMTISCDDKDCFNIHIGSINLCNNIFNGSAGTAHGYEAKLSWDYLHTGQYEKFSLNVISGNLLIPSSKLIPDRFDKPFSNYMNTGKC